MKYQVILPLLKKSCFILLLSFSMLILAIPAPTYANFNNIVNSITNYYISPIGNDLNPGTLDQPFATLQKLLTSSPKDVQSK